MNLSMVTTIHLQSLPFPRVIKALIISLRVQFFHQDWRELEDMHARLMNRVESSSRGPLNICMRMGKCLWTICC